MKNNCSCKYCSWHRIIKEEKPSPKIVKILDDMMMGIADAEYNQAVLDGSWPSSVDILKRKLKEAIIKKKKLK